MVDLKDRINKPRNLRGTPAYSYVNKVSFVAVLVCWSLGSLLGYEWWRKENNRDVKFIPITDRDEVVGEAYLYGTRQMLEGIRQARKDEEENEQYRP